MEVTFRSHNTFRDFNANVGKGDIFRLTTGKHSWHEQNNSSEVHEVQVVEST